MQETLGFTQTHEPFKKGSSQNYSHSIVKTNQFASTSIGNIFLFTAERVLEYKELPHIDFLVLDEFYKLSTVRDDERSDSLNNAVYKLFKKYSCRFLFLGPNIESISPGFTDAYLADFYKTSYSLVLNESIDLYKGYEGQFGARGKKKLKKEKVLFNLLQKLQNEQSIVFCSSPNRVRMLSKAYMEFLRAENKNKVAPNVPLIEWIDDNVHENWSVKSSLEYGIGIHDGALPRHITASIINYFNDGNLKVLFCTTTIIEGVNTSAKNIMYFDNKKGQRTPIDYFDYSNIKGRAGRMMIHLVGKIYNFNEPPKEEKVVVDIPFFEQNPVSNEILINLSEEDIKNPQTTQNEYIRSFSDEERMILGENGVSVRGQDKILQIMRDEKNTGIFTWSGLPTYDELTYVINLAWEHLIKEGETTRPMTAKKLVRQVFFYGNGESVRKMIVDNFKYSSSLVANENRSEIDILDTAIKDTFQILRHWIEYKVPKWLSVMNKLQEYICHQKNIKPGNYIFYANHIENYQIPPHLTILLDYNVPSSAVKKMMKMIPETIGDEELVAYIKSNNIIEKAKLTLYEKHFLL